MDDATLDFDTVKNNILKAKASRILDFGCGNERLFPLYQDFKIEQVVAQDISANALVVTQQNINSNVLTCLQT